MDSKRWLTIKIPRSVPLWVAVAVMIIAATIVLMAQQPFNLFQANGVTLLTGNGITGTGSPRVTIASDNTGFAVNSTLSAETTKVIGTVNPGNTQNTTPWLVSAAPTTTGGLSIYHTVCAATTNTANVKASAGQVYGIRIYDNVSVPVYAKLHNTAGVPTAGAGIVETIAAQAGVLSVVPMANGSVYGTGIGISIVRGITDADATVTAASDCVVDVYYK